MQSNNKSNALKCRKEDFWDYERCKWSSTNPCPRAPYRVCETCIFGDPEDNQEFQGLCTHKDLFKSFYFREILGTLVLMIIMALSTMAGIGGGGVVILLIKEFMVFSLKRSISLSQFSIFACSVTRYILNFS